MDTSNLPGDFTEEFRRVRGKELKNHDLAVGLGNQDVQGKGEKHTYGATNPFPWELPVTSTDILALNEALAKKFHCPKCDLDVGVTYEPVVHTHRLKFNDTGNGEIDKIREQIDRDRFGPRTRKFVHIGVFCSGCKRFIQYVPSSKANRRAAKDPLINGPHQWKKR